MRRHALFFLLLVSCTLSGCDDTTNEKILAELKEICPVPVKVVQL